MFQMIEVVGTSGSGFSEAVKDAVDQIIKKGHQVFWFEILEQRGSVKEGRLKEYQVKLKIGASFE